MVRDPPGSLPEALFFDRRDADSFAASAPFVVPELFELQPFAVFISRSPTTQAATTQAVAERPA